MLTLNGVPLFLSGYQSNFERVIPPTLRSHTASKGSSSNLCSIQRKYLPIQRSSKRQFFPIQCGTEKPFQSLAASTKNPLRSAAPRHCSWSPVCNFTLSTPTAGTVKTSMAFRIRQCVVRPGPSTSCSRPPIAPPPHKPGFPTVVSRVPRDIYDLYAL